MSAKYLISKERPETVGDFSFKYEYQKRQSSVIMDSFDYLLLNKGYCLMEGEDGVATLLSCTGIEKYDGIENPDLRSIIDGVIAPRVLLPKHKMSIETHSASMLDDLDKTIAKGQLLVFDVEGEETYAIHMLPLRGYEHDMEKGIKALDVTEAESIKQIITEALSSTGDEMLGYSSKPTLALKADMPLYKVMGGIYSHLIDVMAKNADGIIEDIDIEFLHDFRVSVRRIRSALSLIRGVYDKGVEQEFRGLFRELGGLTGTARDMDVYMDTIKEYEEMLPDWLKGELTDIGAYFNEVREKEYNKLSVYLLSGDFKNLHDNWLKVISSDKYVTKKGKKSVISVAKKAIYKQFIEIELQVADLTHESHSDAVHEVRISFKKIRYLLEFFASLFDKETITPMLKDMKVLQDSLGAHNDFHIQQLMLEELVESDKWDSKTSSACGFLAAKLAEKQSQERKRVLTLILNFMGYKKLFEELFS